MRRTLAIVSVLALLVSASPAAALACLNSKPCNGRCIAYKQACTPVHCGWGYYLCNGHCISKRFLCQILN